MRFLFILIHDASNLTAYQAFLSPLQGVHAQVLYFFFVIYKILRYFVSAGNIFY